MASGAKLIWSAELDPGIIEVEARPASLNDPDAIDPAWLEPWMSVVCGSDASEHAVLSDGLRRIRLDVAAGTLRKGPVVLHYRLAGIGSLRPRVLPLRRLLALCTHRRFVSSLFPPDPRISRWVDVLRAHDAVRAGAGVQEIAEVIFGRERVERDADRGSESVRSRARRLVREARSMAAGGYRKLMRQGE